MNDHAGYPSYCQEKGLNPMQCVEEVICPAYTPEWKIDNDQILEIGRVPSSMLSVTKFQIESCIDKVDTCHVQNCFIYFRYMEHYCQRTCHFCVHEDDTMNLLTHGEGRS